MFRGSRNYHAPSPPSLLTRLFLPLLLLLSLLPLLLTFLISHQYTSFYVPPSPYIPHVKRVSGSVSEVRLYFKKKEITYEGAIELMKVKDREFMEVFLETLKSCTYESFYLEFTPINRNNMDITPFSYALVDATDDYKDVEIDTTTFIRYMGSKESTSFKNEFKNETIILPTLKWNPEAVYPLEVYKSVGTWIRENSLRLQSVHVFSMLAKVAELEIKEGGDVWVSTSGKENLGYANFRVQRSSIYYRYEAYKKIADGARI
ncbi:hypothetical protein TrLO_g10596 [Triparma laevis f. longispina]|uniref:Uncharacterized protein n=1 Tax=Triparma laevis f. longispina TaxID=1714387 RepID=A0A9W7AJN9_9STRA|nr:hypothetical protein TrLO_g10596 [Triparma laevis f. longispina]